MPYQPKLTVKNIKGAIRTFCESHKEFKLTTYHIVALQWHIETQYASEIINELQDIFETTRDEMVMRAVEQGLCHKLINTIQHEFPDSVFYPLVQYFEKQGSKCTQNDVDALCECLKGFVVAL